MLAAMTYLANRPDGIVLAMLFVAIILFAFASVAAVLTRAFWAAIVCAGFAFLTLAFLVH